MEYLIIAGVVLGIWWFMSKGSDKSPGAAWGWIKDRLGNEDLK